MLEKVFKLLIAAGALLILISIANTLYSDEIPPSNQFFLGSENKTSLEIFKEKDTVTPLIQSEVAKLSGSYAVYIKDLKNNEVFTLNADQSFPSASIYKLGVMYKTYDALDKNEIEKDELLSASQFTLNEKLEGKNEGQQDSDDQVVSHTVGNALKLMITVSDNYSAILLADRFGWENMDTLMETEGFALFNMAGENSPNVTAKSAGDLLERIYRNKAVSHLASNEMKTLLFAQTVNDRIPKYLPKNVKVGHKTGELDTIRHDAGIVLGKKGDYIFVILTDTPNPGLAPENIARLAEKIFAELEK